MAKKTKLIEKTDDSGIPDFLNRALNNVKPASAPGKPAAAEKAKPRPFAQPKGMSDEEWARIQKAKAVGDTKPAPVTAAAKAAVAKATGSAADKLAAAKAAKAERIPLEERKVDGKLSAHDIGRKLQVPAKLVRRALRTLKTLPKPAEGWFFAPKDFDKVAAVVHEFLNGARDAKAARGQKKAKGGKVAKAKPATAPAANGEAKASKPAKGGVTPTPMDQIAKPAPRTRAAAQPAKAKADTKRSKPVTANKPASKPVVTLAALFAKRKAAAAAAAK